MKDKEFNYKSTKEILKRIFKENVLPHIGKFIIAVFLMIIVAASTAYLAYLVKPALDEIFVNKDAKKLIIVPLLILLITVVKGLATYFQVLIMTITTQKITINMQRKLFSHLMYSDVDFFESKTSGKIIAHMGSDIGGVMTAINLVLTGLIRQALTVVFLVGVMMYQSLALTCIAFIALPLIILPLSKIAKRLKKLANKNLEEGAEFTSVINDSVESVKLVKSYCCEDYETNRVSIILNRIYKLGVKMARTALITSPLMEMLGGIGIAGVIWYGGHSIISGETTQGEFFSFLTALLTAYKPMKSFANLNITLQTALVSARRLFVTMDTKPEITDNKDAKILKNIKGDIELKNINFYYPYHDPKEDFIKLTKVNNKKLSDIPTLKNLSLKVPSKKTIALVGHSGGGKSTVFKIISRFYDSQKGEVIVDGHNIKDITIKSLRDNIAIVSQDAKLFNLSIKENIRYGKLDATDKEIKQAAKLAAADEFIEKLPDGYDAVVGQGGSLLSGGQKQRISIARAFLKNASILLLDEATSALDPISEKLIQKALKELMKKRTTIIIAHRLSTIINADTIYVISEGTAVEEGKHFDLLKKNGMYSELYKNQFDKEQKK